MFLIEKRTSASYQVRRPLFSFASVIRHLELRAAVERREAAHAALDIGAKRLCLPHAVLVPDVPYPHRLWSSVPVDLK